MPNEKTIACRYCGRRTMMLGTKLCDPCWELERRIEYTPELALAILCKLSNLDETKEKSIHGQIFGV
jgi:NMD protein affecting ribosome stability and mRNA decay